MTALNSLALAVDLAAQKRDLAALQLVQLQRAYRSAEGQLAQLGNYAGETAAKWAAGAKEQTSTELLRHHYQFMDRLQQAIDLQQGVLEDQGRHVDRARMAVLEAESRLAALQQVWQKRQADRARLQARREQRQTDEMAGQLHRRLALMGERG